MTKRELAEQIAEELSDLEMIDMHNFATDKAAIEATANVIFNKIKNYTIISGFPMEEG